MDFFASDFRFCMCVHIHSCLICQSDNLGSGLMISIITNLYILVDLIIPSVYRVFKDPKEKAKAETRDWLNNVVCMNYFFCFSFHA